MRVDLNTLKKGTRFKQYDSDPYNYIVVANHPGYVRYKVDDDSRRAYSHPKNWPTIMVTVLNK
jgi:hypothetical protein